MVVSDIFVLHTARVGGRIGELREKAGNCIRFMGRVCECRRKQRIRSLFDVE
jgi:hypothetical protein